MDEIKPIINKLVNNTDLSTVEIEHLFTKIMSGEATPAQIGSVLTSLRMKGETIDEITGAAKIMRHFSTKIPVKSQDDLLDTCGTGGDGSNTFNISTAAAITAASCGIRVAKHGNRSVSSKCGSADVLKELGANLEITPEKVGQCVDEVGIGFLFAPLLHGSMKYAIGPRRELGIRSIFNVLGPLTNPAGAKNQLMGVFSHKLVKPIASVLNNLGAKKVMVVHGSDGLDEITTTGKTLVCEYTSGKEKEWELNPEDFGIELAQSKDLIGGEIKENAEIIKAIFSGEKNAKSDIVVLNAGAGIYVAGGAQSIEEGIKLAKQAIESGKAAEKLQQLIDFTNS